MSEVSLPNLDGIQQAAQEDATSDQCRKLLIQAIMYGTTIATPAEKPEKEVREREEEVAAAQQSKCQEAAKVLQDAWKACPQMEDTLVDVLWLCSSMIPTTDEKSTKAMVDILKALVEVPSRDIFWSKLQSNLGPTLLDAAGLVEQDLLKKIKMYNTQMYYKQQKYNLLQEESEGYSKILHFLITSGSGSENGNCDDIEQRRSRLRELIGTFELDPNRILDLLVDVLELKLFPNDDNNYNNSNGQDKNVKPHISVEIKWLLGLMKEFSLDKLPPLIGFKMADPTKKVSPGLLRTVALLVSQKLLDLKAIIGSYFPSIDEKIEEAHKSYWMKEKKRVLALARITLSDTKKEDPKQIELEKRLQQQIKNLEATPGIQVAVILLQWGEWEQIKPLLSDQLWSHLCTLLPQQFGHGICDVVQARITPMYQKLIPVPALSSNSMEDGEVNSSLDEEYTIEKLIDSVLQPLLVTIHSGCIGSRPVVYSQLCRILGKLLKDHGDQQLDGEMYELFQKILVPSLSLFSSSPAISTDLWSVLCRFSYTTRYRLYGDWRGSGLERAGLGLAGTGKPLVNVEQEMVAGKAARYALKRLSKDNVRDISRQLAKVTHSNPLVVFATILNQIESYDNMVEVMVEAQRFVNPLGLDVLGYCILTRLSGMAGGVNRSRLKEDGVNVSQWLQSLEAFTGAYYKRYPFVEFRGILCYLLRRLQDGNVMELGVLQTLLKVSGGYSFADFSPAASLSVTQLEGRAGSTTLQRETMSFGIVEDVNIRASDRIREVLQSDGFGISMLVLIAQVRSRVLFEATGGKEKPVKLIGNLYDSCQVVMSILLQFLIDTTGIGIDKGGKKSQSAINMFAQYMPTLEELVKDCGLDAATTWMLCRPLVRAAQAKAATVMSEEGEGIDEMDVDDDKGDTETNHKSIADFFNSEYTKRALQHMVPEAVWSDITHELFQCFYTKSLYDLFCPETIYTAEIARLNKEVERIQHRQKTNASSSLHLGAGKPDEGLDRMERVSSTLSDDFTKHKVHVAKVKADIIANKDNFFTSEKVSQSSVNKFLAHCIFPRSTQSPDDAIYCARFVLLLHEAGTPGFSTMHYIDELISVISGSLFGVTEGEAAHLAILLWETWKVVNSWRYEKSTFDEEVAEKPGSYFLSEKSNEDEEQGDNDDGEEDKDEGNQENEKPECATKEEEEKEAKKEEREKSNEPKSITYKKYITLYNKWHLSLGAALIGCLKSDEYMHTRAGLVILTRLVEVFPTRPHLGNKFLEVLAPLQDESSSRPDIRASASAYGMMLIKARDEGKWVEEDASVARARIQKEKAAAAARKKKIAENFEEMKLESDKIASSQRDDGRGSGGGDRRRLPQRDLRDTRGSGGDAHRTKSSPLIYENGNQTERDDKNYRSVPGRGGGGGGGSSSTTSDRRDHSDRRGFSRPTSPLESDRGRDNDRSTNDDRGRGRTSSERQHNHDNRRRDGGSSSGNPVGSHRSSGGSGREEPRGLGSRWTPNDSATMDGRGRNKRSRPSSPELGSVENSRSNDGRGDERHPKRQRVRQGGGGGSGGNDYDSRNDNRGSSPSRRRGGPPSPRSPQAAPPQQSRNRRRRS